MPIRTGMAYDALTSRRQGRFTDMHSPWMRSLPPSARLALLRLTALC